MAQVRKRSLGVDASVAGGGQMVGGNKTSGQGKSQAARGTTKTPRVGMQFLAHLQALAHHQPVGGAGKI
jgi:hypothetical protein